MPSWYALKRHVRKSALVQVREHLGGWLRFFFGTLGLFDFLNKTKLELYYTCKSRRYFVHQYIIFRDFLNYEILVRKSYSEYKFWDEWHGFYLAGLSLPISSYLRQQIEYHAILWWTNQRKWYYFYMYKNILTNLFNFCHLVNDEKISDNFLNAKTADEIHFFESLSWRPCLHLLGLSLSWGFKIRINYDIV